MIGANGQRQRVKAARGQFTVTPAARTVESPRARALALVGRTVSSSSDRLGHRLCYHLRFRRGGSPMPVRSKWESLPTEAINPATLAIDKLSPADIVEGMMNEDRKVVAAVHREKERIAVGIEILTQALRRGG